MSNQRRAKFVLGSIYVLAVFVLFVTCDDNLNNNNRNNILSKKINNNVVSLKSNKVISNDDKYEEKENVLKGVNKFSGINKNIVTPLPTKAQQSLYDGLFKDAKNGE